MWPRKQLDIGWTDLVFGLLQVVASRAPLPHDLLSGTIGCRQKKRLFLSRFDPVWIYC